MYNDETPILDTVAVILGRSVAVSSTGITLTDTAEVTVPENGVTVFGFEVVKEGKQVIVLDTTLTVLVVEVTVFGSGIAVLVTEDKEEGRAPVAGLFCKADIGSTVANVFDLDLDTGETSFDLLNLLNLRDLLVGTPTGLKATVLY